MIYRFQCKASGDVIMSGATGERVLRALGLAPAVRGILEPVAMPAAIRAVESAIEHDDADRARRGASEHDHDDTAPASDDPDVSLRRRAWPLVEMLRRAHEEGVPVVWGV